MLPLKPKITTSKELYSSAALEHCLAEVADLKSLLATPNDYWYQQYTKQNRDYLACQELIQFIAECPEEFPGVDIINIVKEFLLK